MCQAPYSLPPTITNAFLGEGPTDLLKLPGWQGSTMGLAQLSTALEASKETQVAICWSVLSEQLTQL